MKKETNTFKIERLIIKPTTNEDAEFMLSLLNTPLWHKNIGDRNVKSIEEAEKYIKYKIEPQFKKLGFSNYTIIRKTDKKKIGI